MIRKLAATLTVAASLLVASPAHAATTAPPAEVAALSVFQNLDLAAPHPSSAAQTVVASLVAARSYTVRPGDNLSRIAARYCGTASAYRSLATASGIVNPDRIWPGQRITLTCAGPVAPAVRTQPKVHAQTASVAVGGSASGAVAYAMQQIGMPYIWGATGPNGYDCSGLVVAAYRAIGISLPHFTGDLLGLGTPVSRANLRPGDLVFLSSSHVGLAIDGDRVVVAPQSGESVKVQSIYAFYAARRI